MNLSSEQGKLLLRQEFFYAASFDEGITYESQLIGSDAKNVSQKKVSLAKKSRHQNWDGKNFTR